METREAINKRVSVRKYKEKQINDEQLKMILDAAKKAPVGMGKYDEMQITVIQDKKLLEELNEEFQKSLNNQNKRMFHGAPTGIIVSGKPTNYCGMEYDNGACIIENMILMATDLNLGTVYLKGIILFLENNKELLEKLNIKKDFVPLAGMAVGYPEEEITPKEHHIEINII